jgi:hypothetical protein
MKTKPLAVVFILTAFVIASCGNKQEMKNELKKDGLLNENEKTTNAEPSAYFSKLTAGDESVPQIANIFLDTNTDYKAATLELQPSLEDCKIFFRDDALAKKAFDYYTKEFQQERTIIKPNPGQKESIVAFASQEYLLKKTYFGKVKEIFPEGYHNAATLIKPGIKVFAIKFIDHNQSNGIVYNGFALVNSHWKVFPDPWKIK